MHSFVHGRRLEVIPSKRANGTVLVRCEVEEVDVLGSFVAKVVVLSVIGDQRDGSGSRGTRRLVENHGGGSCTHVVVELDGTNVLEGSRGK